MTHCFDLFYVADSCLVLHGWNNFEVCFWLQLSQHTLQRTAQFICTFALLPLMVLITICVFYSYYETKAVLLAMGITTIVCIAVTVFCFQTKVDGDVNCFCLSLSRLCLVRGCLCCECKRTPLSRVTMEH